MKAFLFVIPLFGVLGRSHAQTKHGIEAQAGLHVIYSYSGTTPPQQLYDLISDGKVGGIILFGDNVDDNLPATIQDLQDTYASSELYLGSPLLIMTDQEGGEVARLPGGPAQSAKEVGETADPAATATETGQNAASVLLQYNNNVNLAPVLDVFRTPGDFDDEYQRSFSNDSSVVGECGAAFITAQQAAGVIATAKHFPGLGAATADENTDEVPVTLNVTVDELRAIDEAPYVQAIAAGVDMVMCSWALYPAVDADWPSGLSSTWIQGELRGRLGFKGVTITDAIEAGALENFGDSANRGVLASRAGMDLIMAAAGNVTQGESVVAAIISNLQAGTLDMGDFDKASQRILELRSKLPAV